MTPIIKQVPDWSEVSEVELIYKSKVKVPQRIKIDNSNDLYNVLKAIWDENTLELKECFKVILLSAGRIQGIYEVASGGINCVKVDIRLVFTAALQVRATAIILAHNHPSGNLIPSEADISFTHELQQAGKILNIQVNDHLIITREGYTSLLDEGLLKTLQ